MGDSVVATGNAATVFFVPAANFNGPTTFDYAAVDNNAAQDATAAIATITVGAVNNAPETNAGSGSGNEDAASIAVSLSGSDLDGTVASFHIISLPANGTLYSDAGLTTVLAVGRHVAASGNAATVYFVPDANFNGPASFDYAAVDNDRRRGRHGGHRHHHRRLGQRRAGDQCRIRQRQRGRGLDCGFAVRFGPRRHGGVVPDHQPAGQRHAL